MLGKVLEQKIDLERTSPKFRKILARCLDRNPKDRLRDIGEARFLLASEATSPVQVQQARSRWLWPMRLALSLVALIALAMVYFRAGRPEPPKLVRFQFTPGNVSVGSSARPSLSPDGANIAYYAAGSDGVSRLWIRAMDSLESRPLSATDLNINVPIFWSYDSRFVLFPSAEKLKKIDISGGPAQSLCDIPAPVVGRLLES